MAMKFIERENEILATIRSFWDAGLEFVVVGGYAVSGLARHRFSVDLDVVIKKEYVDTFTQILEEQGFEKHIEHTGFDDVYKGEFVSYVKRIYGLLVTVDLLVGSLVCRATAASWNYGYIKRNTMETDVTGIELSVRCRVPRRELLIAFKIHSGRRADVRDIVVLMEQADIEKIGTHLKRGSLEQLQAQIDRMIEMLRDTRLVDSLKGVFSISHDVTKQIERAYRVLEELKNRI